MNAHFTLLGALMLALTVGCGASPPHPEVPAADDADRRVVLREAIDELRAEPDARRAGAELGRASGWLDAHGDVLAEDPALASLYLDAAEAAIAQVRSHVARVAAERESPRPEEPAPARAPDEPASAPDSGEPRSADVGVDSALETTTEEP